ncbi:MAG: hypothetical protein POELPBGB_02485 [Bacteroidia bacterium]|nr:hypothetical protein [Bacteroidia bacterium]
MNTIKSIAVLVAFTFFTTIVFAQKKVKDTYLHKKNYLVEVTMKGGKKTKIFAEEIGFSSGKIKTKHMMMADNGGFVQGDYEVTKADTTGEARTFDFKGSIKNAKEEYLLIKGTVFGDMIDGTMTWETSKHKVKTEMTFTGNVKEKGEKYIAAEKTVANPNSQKASSGKAGDAKSSGKKEKEDKSLDDEILNDDLE